MKKNEFEIRDERKGINLGEKEKKIKNWFSVSVILIWLGSNFIAMNFEKYDVFDKKNSISLNSWQ